MFKRGDTQLGWLHVTVYTLYLLIYFIYVDSASAELWEQVSSNKQFLPHACVIS